MLYLSILGPKSELLYSLCGSIEISLDLLCMLRSVYIIMLHIGEVYNRCILQAVRAGVVMLQYLNPLTTLVLFPPAPAAAPVPSDHSSLPYLLLLLLPHSSSSFHLIPLNPGHPNSTTSQRGRPLSISDGEACFLWVHVG